MFEIFCPICGALILDEPGCPVCDWQRLGVGDVGAQVWRADLGTQLNKPPCYAAVAAGHYCLGTENGKLMALSIAAGRLVWERVLGKARIVALLATDGEHLFVT